MANEGEFHSALDLAHDLRGAVVLSSEHSRLLLEEGERSCAEHRKSIELIQRQLSRLDQIIDGLRVQIIEPAVNVPAAADSGVFSRPRLLIADDDLACIEFLVRLFADHYEVKVAHEGQEALDQLRASDFDIAILSQQIPRQTGLQVAEALSLDARTLPSFLFLFNGQGIDMKLRGLSMGDFVIKPIDSGELLARVARMIATGQRERALVADALRDPLTGLPNYRSLARSLHIELDRARRCDQPLSLLTIDLDDLKGINDTLGHGAGNDAICTVASVLEGTVRKFETVARQGGDELSILLPKTSAAEAVKLGERLRTEVAQHTIRGRALSISIGVASREHGDEDMTVQKLVEASDNALYLAKRSGRNRVSEFQHS